MFKCEACGKNSRLGEKRNLRVVETRKVDYEDNAGRVIGHGHEIVKEIAVCGRCN